MAKEDSVERTLKDLLIALWHWFTDCRAAFVPLLVVAVAMVFIDLPPWMMVFFLLTVPPALWAISNRRGAKEIAGEPFTFCMPGYRESLRKSSFVRAFCSGLGFAPFGLFLAWLGLPRGEGPTATAVVACILSAFCVGTAVFLCINVDFRFVVSRLAWSLLLLLSIPLLLLGVVVFSAGIEYPALGIPLGLAICIFVWIRLGDMRCVKRGHRMIIEDALDRRSQAGVTRTAAPWVEGLFVGPANGVQSTMGSFCLWGSLYRTFGLILSYWKWILVSIVGSALVLGYTGEWIAFIALGLVASVVNLPIASDMLLPEGRREKQCAAVVAAIATTVLLVVVALLVIALSWCLSKFMAWAFGADYAGIALRNVCLPSVVVPWIFVMQLLDYDELSPAWTCISRAAAVSMIAIAFFGSQICHWSGIPRPLFFATVFLAGWVFLLPILRHVCTRGHLAGQGLCVES